MSTTIDAATTTQALTNKILELMSTPDDPALSEAQALLARRIASSAALAPVRVPAPANITEMGGYLNLLERAGEDTLRLQAISAALGLAGPMDTPYNPGGPDIGFAKIDGLRVTDAAKTAAPAQIEVRMDLSGPLKTAMSAIEARGFELPLLTTRTPLPAEDATAPDAGMMMKLTGRCLRVSPATALKDPATDGVVVVNGGGGIEVHLRQVDSGAADAGSVVQATIDAFTCDATSCTPASVSLLVEPLAPFLAVAGWYKGPRSAPSTLSDQGDWDTFYCATGLVAGETTFGEELARLYPGHLIAASAARHVLGATWDGTEFKV